MEIEHLAHFHIAGFTYYNGPLVFSKLKIGKKLEMKLEEDNKYDARAIAIFYKNQKIGFVPKTENRILYKMLKIGLEKNLRMVVQMVNPAENPERQVQVLVHLVNESVSFHFCESHL